ncbi:hypothetical protein GT347_06145 [Xylophilus rhododendri]|uniref:Uncharacterized protein n=1 Tax=Xylophilus rhododendri TaxID=2697032 RepID=A0A857J417_9BURK|nr:hypothetical protein [Xylophilus rhododendri]QHI97605.1 hypothetical protein GT347_06145 [Xylophilus rhododendri]
MNTVWYLVLLALAIFLAGAALATVLWWCAMPGPMVRRWLAPLLDAVEIGFAEQVLQHRERSQRDKLWARKQQAQWSENEELRMTRHEAHLLAEIRLLLRASSRTGPAALSAVASPSAPAHSNVRAGRGGKQFEPSVGTL